MYMLMGVSKGEKAEWMNKEDVDDSINMLGNEKPRRRREEMLW